MKTIAKFNKLKQWISITLFLLLLFIPLFGSFLIDDQFTSEAENRVLSTKPKFPTSVAKLIEYPSQFANYFSDHFGFRETLTKQYFKLVSLFGAQGEMADVTVGQDGWYFLGSTRAGYKKDGDPIGDAINRNLFTQTQLIDFVDRISTINEWLKTRGIHYVYMIAPNKHTIYFDKLPTYLKKQGPYSATDQVVNYLREHTDVHVVDVRSALLAKKDQFELYHKRDTHWNQMGSNIAQYELVSELAKVFPELTPKLIQDSRFRNLPFKTAGLARMAGLDEGGDTQPVPQFSKVCVPINRSTDADRAITRIKETCDRGVLNALIFRDSFFEAMRGYTSRQFLRSVYRWERINHQALIDELAIRKPDFVIEEVVERLLPYLPDSEGFEDQ